MKPVANLWRDKDGSTRALVVCNDNPLMDVDVTHLFTEEQVKQNELEVRKNERELIVCKLRAEAHFQMQACEFYDDLAALPDPLGENFDLLEQGFEHGDVKVINKLADKLEKGIL